MNAMDILRKNLYESSYTVALCCNGLLAEVGRPSMREQSRDYEIEKKYGHSSEEMFSAAYFSTRPEKFFEFYKAEVLPPEGMHPGKSYECLKVLEERNLIQLIITNDACNFFSKAGCKSVLPLHGDVEDNVCTNCGKRFNAEYVVKSKGVPRCDACGKLIRPKVVMFGEMVDNRLMTQAINEITKADMLLVIGSDLGSPFAERYVKYFGGKKLILINPEESYKDKVADLAIHRPISDVLCELAETCLAWREL